jgi:peptidoglycan/LPS O-acetylase OafA/YrhL
LSGGTPGPSDQLPSLTPLRGVAALWVVLYRYCGTAQFLPNLDITPHSYLISKGYLAVDMFFILSGLVMAHVYRRAFSEGVGEHYRGFLVARIARLAPERPKQNCNRRKFPSGSTRMREQIFRGVPDVTNRA